MRCTILRYLIIFYNLLQVAELTARKFFCYRGWYILVILIENNVLIYFSRVLVEENKSQRQKFKYIFKTRYLGLQKVGLSMTKRQKMRAQFVWIEIGVLKALLGISGAHKKLIFWVIEEYKLIINSFRAFINPTPTWVLISFSKYIKNLEKSNCLATGKFCYILIRKFTFIFS